MDTIELLQLRLQEGIHVIVLSWQAIVYDTATLPLVQTQRFVIGLACLLVVSWAVQ